MALIIVVLVVIIGYYISKPKPKPRYIRPLRRNERHKRRKKQSIWY